MTLQHRNRRSRRRGYRYPLPTLTLALALTAMVFAARCPDGVAQVPEPEYDPDVIIVMKDQHFRVVKGDGVATDSKDPRFSLVPGGDIVLMLRNEDRIAHEFVSPLFQHVEMQFSGRATLVYTHTASGLRLDPGETVLVRFSIPTEPAYDLFHFWCNLHGKLYGDPMRGEVFILQPEKAASH